MRRALVRGALLISLVIAGLAVVASPRLPYGPTSCWAQAAADSAATDTTAAPSVTTPVPADTSAVAPTAPDTTAATAAAPAPAPADTTRAMAGPTLPADTTGTAAAADSAKAGSFASEPPETLRFVPPADYGPPPEAATPPEPGATNPRATAPVEPEKPYGPMPKGPPPPGAPEKPKQKHGLWGVHPAAIIAGLVVVHVLVVRLVTH